MSNPSPIPNKPPPLPKERFTPAVWVAYLSATFAVLMEGGLVLEWLGFLGKDVDNYSLMVAFFYGCPAALLGLIFAVHALKRGSGRHIWVPLVICTLILLPWPVILVLELLF